MPKEKGIIIKQPFNEQYTLTIEMEAKLIDSFMTSCTKLRYDFTVINCNESEIECRIVLLDIHLEKSNNDLIKEVARLTAAFNRMFNELHLKLSQDGKIKEVLNMDLIISKWEETKLEMKSVVAHNDELRKLVAINDALFTNKEKLKTAIQGNEFLQYYFGHIYDADLPFEKKIVGTNIFNTANLEWNIVCEPNVPLPAKDVQTVVVSTKASPQLPLSDGFCNAAYNQFTDKVKISPMNIRISEEELRYIDYETGRVKKSSVIKSEVVYPEKLYHKISFSLLSDSERRIVQEKQNEEKKQFSVAQEPEKEESKPEVYKVVDGKELTYKEWKLYEEKQWEIYQTKKKKKGFLGF